MQRKSVLLCADSTLSLLIRTCYDVLHKSSQTKITTYNLYCVAFCLHFSSGSQGSHVSMVINSNLTQCYYSCCFLCLHSYPRLTSFSSESQNTMVYRTFLTFFMLKFLGEKNYLNEAKDRK